MIRAVEAPRTLRALDVPVGRGSLAPEHAAALRTRRHPRPTQFDYLHLRRLLDDLEVILPVIAPPGGDVLDVFCGSRPYDDLLPSGARAVGLDVTDDYGVADLVTTEFLPFADASFDAVICLQAFHYVAAPAEGVRELRRVLRPGGRVLLTVPHVWEYDRHWPEHRFTGLELVGYFQGWEEVRVKEQGGRGVTWTTQTGLLLETAHERLRRRLGPALAPGFAAATLALNVVGAAVERLEQRYPRGTLTLPPNLLVSARRPTAH